MDTTSDREHGYSLLRADKTRATAHEITSSELGKHKNILVVDDSEDIVELLSVLLIDAGTVSTAINGVDALYQFASKCFDLVISDIEMPLMNGIDLYKYVTTYNPKYKNRFLFFSGTLDEETAGYLSRNNLLLLRKPQEIRKLQLTVQKILQ